MKRLTQIVLLAVAVLAITSGFTLNKPDKNKSVFVHSVYFWLKEDVTNDDKARFFELLRGLEDIRSVEELELGIPAGTPRTVVDNTYDVALLVYFKDKEGHDFYQDDRIHTEAIEEFEDWIADIRIYDAICAR